MVWLTILRILCLLASAPYKLYITQGNDFRKRKKFPDILSFVLEKGIFPPFDWYGGAILAIPENLPLLTNPQKCFKFQILGSHHNK
jgi:hypothetical protein